MTEWSVQRPWKLWVREVEACGLYVNSARGRLMLGWSYWYGRWSTITNDSKCRGLNLVPFMDFWHTIPPFLVPLFRFASPCASFSCLK